MVGETRSSDGFHYLPYLPYCVSTLKVGIKNLEERSIRIRIRPKNSRNDDQFCCGFDDENRGIMVIWGGGSEEGIESNLEISESKYLYFMLYHKSDLISSSYDLTLEVNKLFGYGEIRSEIEEMKIKLEPLSESTEIIRARYIQESSEINFDGTKICCYYPRWFPELQSQFLLTESSDFYSNCSKPPFTLNIKRKSSGDTYDAISLMHEKKGNIAVVSGDMDGATVHCELYALCSGVYIIRIWLFWISKDQFRNKSNLEVIKIARERGMRTPELPDCERYDIVSDEIGNILWIGTDFHWQEYWYA
ncbi:MAG TPA: hypothetical protein VJS91_10945, partial [Nitrososphaeraceae archaeon]|nr:hypothetical protein [Nitrososphaeraceae archaeon]